MKMEMDMSLIKHLFFLCIITIALSACSLNRSIQQQFNDAAKENNTSKLEEIYKSNPVVLDSLTFGGIDNKQVKMIDASLYWAAARGSLESIKWLLEHGASHETRFIKGSSAYCAAVTEGKVKVVQFMTDKGLVSALCQKVNNNGPYATPLFFAAYRGHEEIVRILLHNANKDMCGWTGTFIPDDKTGNLVKVDALYAARKNGNEKIIQLIVDAKVKFKCVDDYFG